MKTQNAFLLCALLAMPAACVRGQEFPSISGYVTRAVTASDFDVNGFHILCTAETNAASKSVQGVTGSTVACPGDPPFVGEGIVVYYSLSNTETNSKYAVRLERQRTKPPGKISGSAVIEAAPAQEAVGAPDSGLIVRADGYRIRITRKTTIKWNPPLQSLAEVKAGDWIKYKGKQDAAGVLVAASVEIGPNAISSGEEKLRAKGEYDPSAVTAEAKQNYLKDGFAGGCRGSYVRGCDPRRFPPFKDAMMQARIEKIGNSLIPAYQRALPDSDPTKIDFRFQVIDTKLIRDAFTLPSGIILVPHQVVERMQNDSQLAAILADAIAHVLERQQYRAEGKQKGAIAATLAGVATTPYGGGYIAAEGMTAEREILTEEAEQGCRVSLSLLHDAGYDIDQAPMAWWLLDPMDPKPIAEINMPDRVAYLYRVLGETWHNPAASAPQIH